jgi:RNA polymerase sigma factor (sigma-70 family)
MLSLGSATAATGYTNYETALEEIELALDELPDEQREVFVAHELEGRSFKELAEETGVSVNTLLSRKRYAVLHLRERLQSIYDEL